MLVVCVEGRRQQCVEILGTDEVGHRLSALAELAPRFFAEQDYGRPRHQPLQPPRWNGKGRGVRSNLRSGVEQQSFAHSVWPHGALPLSLGDVGRKTVYTQTAHTIGARTRWDESCRLMRTAVAPWSCRIVFF